MAPQQKSLFNMPRFTNQEPSPKHARKRKLEQANMQRDQESLLSSCVEENATMIYPHPSSSLEIKEDLDKKRRREAWNESWRNEFEWAYFDHSVSRIFCTYCKNDSRCKSEFGKGGSINVQHNALTDHARTRAHEDARYIYGYKKVSISEGLNRSREVADQATCNLFVAAYFISKQNLSFATYKDTLELLQVSNCPYMTESMYHNVSACKTFVSYISDSILKQMVEKIKSSCFFSLLMDESTDVGNVQHLIVYASFIEDFEPKTVFLGLLETHGGTSAHLYECSTQFISALGLDMRKLICLGTDGASAMTGRVNGLSTRLKRDNPYMNSIHCIAHRTSLCMVDAVKQFGFAQHIDQVVNQIASLFSRSPLQSTLLQELRHEFGCEESKMCRVNDVRWLSRAKAIHKVCEAYEPLLVYVKSRSSSLWQKMIEFEFIYNIFFMGDILDRLATLSLTFQADYVDITSVISIIETEIRMIDDQFIDEREVDINAFMLDSSQYPIIPDYGPLDGHLASLRTSLKGNMFRSIEIIRQQDGSDLDKSIGLQKSFCECIKQNLLERFPEKDLVASFKALAPSSFPIGRDLKQFGFSDIDVLGKFYGEAKLFSNGETIEPLIDISLLRKEYQYFKAQAPHEWRGRSLRDTWVSIGRNQTTATKYPTLLTLAEIAMLQCSNTAICERGFSIQNIIKTKQRNSLSTKSLDSLMRISIEGPPLSKFDFKIAIDMWKEGSSNGRHIFSENRRAGAIQRS